MTRQKGIVSRFKGKLMKLSKDVNGRFDDYSISPETIQISFHSGFELGESDLL